MLNIRAIAVGGFLAGALSLATDGYVAAGQTPLPAPMQQPAGEIAELRKRYQVEHEGHVLTFDTAQAAMEFLSDQEEWQEPGATPRYEEKQEAHVVPVFALPERDSDTAKQLLLALQLDALERELEAAGMQLEAQRQEEEAVMLILATIH